MTTTIQNTKVASNVHTDTASSIEKMTMSLMGGSSILIGLWAAACFVGALAQSGPIGLFKGYVAAISGM